MATHSITKIYNENNEPILALYRQYDGYYEGHGNELKDFLSEMVIVNGFGNHTPANAANTMGCLAAQLVAHFKKGIGNFYIADIHQVEEEDFNYEIRYIPPKNGSLYGRVSLVGNCLWESNKQFNLYSDDVVPVILRRVQFCYDKCDGKGAKWRELDVIEEGQGHISGYEKGKYKRFLLSRIVGGKIFPA